MNTVPAPGQFVNIMPLYEEGDTEEDMCRKARESISGTNDIMISLGGYGGYVTFGFDHTVVNVPGQKDFKILGNAFYADANPNFGSGFGRELRTGHRHGVHRPEQQRTARRRVVRTGRERIP